MRVPFEAITSSAEVTEGIGVEFAALLQPGMRVAISGELGAGKTVFARGVCRGLGVTAPVTSPTYTIASRYDEGRIPVSHLDLYRLAEGLGSADSGTLEPEFSADRVTLVEWSERAADDLFRPDFEVVLEHVAEQERRISVR